MAFQLPDFYADLYLKDNKWSFKNLNSKTQILEH